MGLVMKLHDVLALPAVASGDVWLRPVGWPQGHAYCVKDGQWCAVPGPRGAVPGLLDGVAELIRQGVIIPEEKNPEFDERRKEYARTHG